MKTGKLPVIEEGHYFKWKHSLEEKPDQPVKFLLHGHIYRIGQMNLHKSSILELSNEWGSEVVFCDIDGTVL